MDIAPHVPDRTPVWTVLATQLGLLVLCSGVGMILYFVICALAGWDATLALYPESPLPERWQVRLQLGLGHFFGFFVSGMLTVWFFYKDITFSGKGWQQYLKIQQAPRGRTLLLSLLLMLVSLPLVMYSLNLNQLVPLPESFKLAEEQAESALKGLLQMEHLSELLANLVLIAVLPAIGEELVFRGVLQQQLLRKMSPLAAILLSSAIFSAVHFQFAGFLPRMLLGVLLGWVFWQSKNIWVPIACHFFNNGIQVLGQYLYGKKMSAIDLEQDIQVPVAFAGISLFMVWAVVRLIRQNTPPPVEA